MAPDPVDAFQLRLVGSWLLWDFLKYENLWNSFACLHLFVRSFICWFVCLSVCWLVGCFYCDLYQWMS